MLCGYVSVVVAREHHVYVRRWKTLLHGFNFLIASPIGLEQRVINVISIQSSYWHIASSTLLIFARYAFKYRCPLKNWMNLWCWCIHSLMLRIRLAGNWRICNYTAAVFFNKIFCFQNRALKIRKCRLGLSPTHKIKYNVNELELELDKCNSLETVKH